MYWFHTLLCITKICRVNLTDSPYWILLRCIDNPGCWRPWRYTKCTETYRHEFRLVQQIKDRFTRVNTHIPQTLIQRGGLAAETQIGWLSVCVLKQSVSWHWQCKPDGVDNQPQAYLFAGCRLPQLLHCQISKCFYVVCLMQILAFNPQITMKSKQIEWFVHFCLNPYNRPFAEPIAWTTFELHNLAMSSYRCILK